MRTPDQVSSPRSSSGERILDLRPVDESPPGNPVVCARGREVRRGIVVQAGVVNVVLRIAGGQVSRSVNRTDRTAGPLDNAANDLECASGALGVVVLDGEAARLEIGRAS